MTTSPVATRSGLSQSSYEAFPEEDELDPNDIFQRVMGAGSFHELLSLQHDKGESLFTADVLGSDFFTATSLKTKLGADVYEGLRKRVTVKAKSKKAVLKGPELQYAVFLEGLRLAREVNPKVYGSTYQRALTASIGDKGILSKDDPDWKALLDWSAVFVKSTIELQAEQVQKLGDSLEAITSEEDCFYYPESRQILNELVYEDPELRSAEYMHSKAEIIAHSAFAKYDTERLWSSNLSHFRLSESDKLYIASKIDTTMRVMKYLFPLTLFINILIFLITGVPLWLV